MDITESFFTNGFVISKDGTKIGYRVAGSGPGCILVHGALMTSLNFQRLGELLSNNFTVYIPDRRGRGISDQAITRPGLQAEVEDILAITEKTGAGFIFGLSSGAVIVAGAAVQYNLFTRVALYEPPLPLAGELFSSWYGNYEKAVDKGNFGKAFVIIINGTIGYFWFRLIPAAVSSFVSNLLIDRQIKKLKEKKVSLRSLITAFRYDYKVVLEAESICDQLINIKAPMLLLGGTRSPVYLLNILHLLKEKIPHAELNIIPRLTHTSPNNDDDPEIVAAMLRDYFTR